MKYKILSAEEIKEMAAINWWHTIPVGWDENEKLVFTPGKTQTHESLAEAIKSLHTEPLEVTPVETTLS